MIHLYRGAPIVRSWSKYQRTIREWALCGLSERNAVKRDLQATEDASLVSCAYCLQLMQPSARTLARNGILAAKQQARL